MVRKGAVLRALCITSRYGELIEGSLERCTDVVLFDLCTEVMLFQLCSLLCSVSVISQHCPKQGLGSVTTIIRTAILSWIVGDSLSARYEDPSMCEYVNLYFFCSHLHCGRRVSGCINATVYQQVQSLHSVSAHLSCPAPEVILRTCPPAFIPSMAFALSLTHFIQSSWNFVAGESVSSCHSTVQPLPLVP
jgi:hypothetical protein